MLYRHALREGLDEELERDENVVVMGNGLAGIRVLEAMVGSFVSNESETLGERLLLSLEAGRDAGGQEPTPGNHLPERSSALLVVGSDPVAITDLRIDAHDDAVTELRRVFGLYSEYEPYYAQRHRDPKTLIAQEVWTRQNLRES